MVKISMEFKTNLINLRTKSDAGAVKSKLIIHANQVLGIIPKNPSLCASYVLMLFSWLVSGAG